MIRNFNKKSILAIGLSAMIISGCGISKMSKKSDLVGYKVTPEILEAHSGKINVTIKGTFPEKYFHKKAVMHFSPVLKFNGETIALKPIVLKGESVDGEGTTITSQGGNFTYTDNIDYVPNMEMAELFVTPLIYKSSKVLDNPELAGKLLNIGEVKLADGVKHTSTRIMDIEKVSTAKHGYEKVTILDETGNIFFVVNQANLAFNYKLNKEDEAKASLTSMKDFVRKGWVIKSVDIDAWASPEGEESFNEGLSERRTKSANKYTNSAFKKMSREKNSLVTVANPEKDGLTKLNAKGEDWSGFMEAVRNSNIQDKSAIINVVNSQPDVAKREQEIRNMSVVYKEIEEDILPSLRRAEIKISAYQPKKTDEQIAMLSTTSPDSLDVKELLYAATLTENANTKLNIYKAAMRIYANDWRGYANAAAIELTMGNTDNAQSLLEKANSIAPNNSEIINNMGVVYAHKDDFNQAETYFMQAKKLGADVNYNMGLVKIAKAEYAEAVQLLNSAKCDYNLALAQLLNNDNDAALNTLKCAEKSAEVYYLMAVTGARNDNAAMIYENLERAIKENASMKEMAKKDAEFVKYNQSNEFVNLVK